MTTPIPPPLKEGSVYTFRVCVCVCVFNFLYIQFGFGCLESGLNRAINRLSRITRKWTKETLSSHISFQPHLPPYKALK